jgi:hypothetical protein
MLSLRAGRQKDKTSPHLQRGCRVVGSREQSNGRPDRPRPATEHRSPVGLPAQLTLPLPGFQHELIQPYRIRVLQQRSLIWLKALWGY